MRTTVLISLLMGGSVYAEKVQSLKRVGLQSRICSRVAKLAATSAADPSEITSYCSAHLAAHMVTVTDIHTSITNAVVDRARATTVTSITTVTTSTTTVTATNTATETAVKTRISGTTILTEVKTISRCGLPSGVTLPHRSSSSSANQARNAAGATPMAFARFRSFRQISLACECYSITPETTTVTSTMTIAGTGLFATKVTTTTSPTVTQTHIKTVTVTTDTTVNKHVTRTTTVLASSTTTVYTVTATPAMFYLYSEHENLFNFAQAGGGSYGENQWIDFGGSDGHGFASHFSITPHGTLGTSKDIGFVRDYSPSSPARVLIREPKVVADHASWTAIMCDITARYDGTCQLHCDGGNGEENRVCATSGQYSSSYQVWYLGGSVSGSRCKTFTPIAISVDA